MPQSFKFAIALCIFLKKIPNLRTLINVTQKLEVNICFWENGADKLAGCKLATNLQVLKELKKQYCICEV